MNDDFKWFGYCTKNKMPYISDNVIYETYKIRTANLLIENLSTGSSIKQQYTFSIDKKRNYIELRDSGIHILTLNFKKNESDIKRSFCFFQPHAAGKSGYSVEIKVKRNSHPDSNRTKLCIKSEKKITKNLLYYTISGCSVEFDFPVIEAGDKNIKYFLIKTPKVKPEFHIRKFIVPDEIEVYPEGVREMNYGIIIKVEDNSDYNLIK